MKKRVLCAIEIWNFILSSGMLLSMLEVTILASGSKGNATFIRTESASFLIDAGLSLKQLKERLALCQSSPEKIDAILITHEHSDHVKALPQWCKRYETPIYCNRHTATILREKIGLYSGWHLFETGSVFPLKNLNIHAFAIPHDAVDPVGFVIQEKNLSFGSVTDLGHVTSSILQALEGINGLLVEANYDEGLLQQDTKRPWAIKQRISSRHGHLSNSMAAQLVEELTHQELSHLALGHLSSDCNRSELALSAVNQVLGESSHIKPWCATAEEVSAPMVIR